MTTSMDIRDYPKLQNPTLYTGITSENADLLRKFISRQRLNGVKLSSIDTSVTRIVVWMRDIDGCADTWCVEQIEVEYLRRLDMVTVGDKTDTTLDGELRAIKQFWKFLDKPQLSIYRKPTKLNLMSSEIISRDQIIKMRDCAEEAGDVRGVALIMTLFGTGCRLSEICDANVKDLEITDQYANLHVDGKTGKRIVPFVIGLPELQTWINCHPCKLNGKANPDAPLFVTYNTRGHGNQRLSTESVEATMRKYKKLAGIPASVRCYPHAFRHRSATQDSRHLTWKELCLKFGWSAYSDMPKRYTHTDQDELQRTVLSAAGVEMPDAEPESPLVVQCPRCKTINRAGAVYCDKCSLPLDEEITAVIAQINNAIENEEKAKYSKQN